MQISEAVVQLSERCDKRYDQSLLRCSQIKPLRCHQASFVNFDTRPVATHSVT